MNENLAYICICQIFFVPLHAKRANKDILYNRNQKFNTPLAAYEQEDSYFGSMWKCR